MSSEGGKPLHLGAHPGEPNADMRELMNDLRDILHEHWEAVDNQLDSAGSRWWEKIAVRASQAHVAGDINSLASAMGTKLIDALWGRGYSRAQATAIYNAIQRSRALGFRTHGLYAIESSLRSKPWLSDGLRLLGTTDQTSTLRKVGKGSARFAIGLPVGGMAVNAVIGDQEAADSDAGMLARWGGMAIGGALGIKAGRKLGAVAGKLERGEYGAKMVAWNFLGDQLANMRDTARFSLSPIFDASRY